MDATRVGDKKEPLSPISFVMLVIFIYGGFIFGLHGIAHRDNPKINMEKHDTSEMQYEYKTIILKDGRNIECIRYRGLDDNSIACNWNNPIQPAAPSYYIGYQLNKE